MVPSSLASCMPAPLQGSRCVGRLIRDRGLQSDGFLMGEGGGAEHGLLHMQLCVGASGIVWI